MCSVYDAISQSTKPFMVLFGLFPFSGRVLWIYTPYSVVLVVLVLASFVSLEVKRWPFYLLQDLLNMGTFVICILTSIIFRKKIRKTLSEIREIELELTGFTYSKKLVFFSYLWLLTNLLLTIFLLHKNHYSYEAIYTNIIYYLPNFIQNVYATTFNNSIFTISLHLRQLAQNFKNSPKSRIISLRKTYNRIHRVASHLNSNANLPLVASFATTLINVTAIIHYWLTQDFSAGFQKEDLTESVMWLVVNAMAVVFVTNVCEGIQKEVNDLAISIHSRLLNTKDDEENALVLQFSLQLIHERIEIWPCGLFKIENRLIYGILGATTTYAVLIFQLRVF